MPAAASSVHASICGSGCGGAQLCMHRQQQVCRQLSNDACACAAVGMHVVVVERPVPQPPIVRVARSIDLETCVSRLHAVVYRRLEGQGWQVVVQRKL
eukprot:362507-Chlamydomonas_euryale.AAC.16